MVAWKSRHIGNMEMGKQEKQGKLQIWKYGNGKVGKQKHVNMDIMKYGSMEVWKYWKYGNEELRKIGKIVDMEI